MDTPASLAAVMAAPANSATANLGSASVHHEIARDIGHQVEMLILSAKRASETKVVQEIQKIKTKMESMNEKIKVITERTNALDVANGVILKTDLQKSIAKLEDVWEGEVGTLKHELWQTIQAHNHNADLMKHHKDAIDQIQTRIAESAPNPELETIHVQLVNVDKVMQREQAKQQQVDSFMQRLSLVHRELTAVSMSGGGHPGMSPWAGAGLGVHPNAYDSLPGSAAMSQANLVAAAHSAGQAALMATLEAQNAQAQMAAVSAKKQQRKGPNQKKGGNQKAAYGNAAVAAGNLRADAIEFVPGG